MGNLTGWALTCRLKLLALFEYDGEPLHTHLAVVSVEDNLAGRAFPGNGQGRLVSHCAGASFQPRHVEAIGRSSCVRCTVDDNLLYLLSPRRGDAEHGVLVNAHMVRVWSNRVQSACMLIVADVQALRCAAETFAVGAFRCRRPDLGASIRSEGDGVSPFVTSAAISCAVERNEIRLIWYSLGSVALIVHQFSVNDNLVADLNICLPRLVFFPFEVEYAEAVELYQVSAVVGDVESSIAIGSAPCERSVVGNSGDFVQVRFFTKSNASVAENGFCFEPSPEYDEVSST